MMGKIRSVTSLVILAIAAIVCPLIINVANTDDQSAVSRPEGKEPTFKSAPVLKAGFIGALSGPAAIYGIAARNGIELALSDLGDSANIKVIYEDDAFVVADTVKAFRKLVEIDKVDVVLSLASQPSNAIAPLAEQAKVPLFAWASDSNVSKGRRYVVRTYPTGFEEGATIAKIALVEGHKKIGVFVSQNDYPLSVVKGLKAHLNPSDIALYEEITPDTTDFRSFIPKLKQKKATLLFLCLNPGMNALVAKQAYQANLKVPILGCENLNSLDELNMGGESLENARFVTVAINPDFRLRYQAIYNNQDVLSGAAIYYDMTMILNSLATTASLKPAPTKTATTQSDFISALATLDYSWQAISPQSKFRFTADDSYLDIPIVPQRMADLR